MGDIVDLKKKKREKAMDKQENLFQFGIKFEDVFEDENITLLKMETSVGDTKKARYHIVYHANEPE